MRLFIRQTALVALSVVLSLTLGGCVGVSLTGDILNSARSGNWLTGQGALQTYTYSGGSYTKVVLDANMEIVYTAAQSDTVTVEIQENLEPYLHVTVADNTLRVTADRSFHYARSSDTAVLYVSTPELSSVVAGGGIVFKNSDTIVGDSFLLDVAGGCDGDIPLEVDSLQISIAGGAALKLRGSAQHMRLDITGGGDIGARSLQTAHAVVSIVGAGTGEISVSDTLNVSISGVGEISYYGNPTVTKNIGGLGTVQKAG